MPADPRQLLLHHAIEFPDLQRTWETGTVPDAWLDAKHASRPGADAAEAVVDIIGVRNIKHEGWIWKIQHDVRMYIWVCMQRRSCQSCIIHVCAMTYGETKTCCEDSLMHPRLEVTASSGRQHLVSAYLVSASVMLSPEKNCTS